jgi:hypothetical protein
LRALGCRKKLEEEDMKEARVLRGKGPLIYPGNLKPEQVRSESLTCLVETDLAIFEKLRNF